MLTVSFCCGVGWGLHSHFCVQPNYSAEVVLRCVVVGVVIIILFKCESSSSAHKPDLIESWLCNHPAHHRLFL